MQTITFYQEPRVIVDFNNDWTFAHDFLGKALSNLEWKNISLPHDWSIEYCFDPSLDGATAYLPGGYGYYKKFFKINGMHKSKRVYLHFDGIYNHSTIAVNGKTVAHQRYGYSPFYLDITSEIASENMLEVQVDRSRYIDSRWYTGAGINRDVELIVVNDLHIDLFSNKILSKVIPEKNIASIEQEIEIVTDNPAYLKQSIVVRSEVYDVKRNKCVTFVEQEFEIKELKSAVKLNMKVSDPALWSIDDPNFYQCITKVFYQSEILDIAHAQFGIRTSKFDANQGFMLNGKPLKIKGVCLHQDAGGLGSAIPEAVWKRRLLKLKDAGVNALRIAHHPASTSLLDLCDRIGLLVQDEFFDEWTFAKDKRLNMRDEHGDYLSQGLSEYFLEDGERIVKTTIKSHVNHPCIFMWSIGNEIEWTYKYTVDATGFFDVSWNGNYFWELAPHNKEQMRNILDAHPRDNSNIGVVANRIKQWVKEENTDKTITANCIFPSVSYLSGYADALDVIGYSYRQIMYEYGHTYYPDQPIIANEALPRWHEWNAVLQHPYVCGVFLWTGIDYLGESHNKWPTHTTNSGLLNSAGFTKDSYYMFKSLWQEKPVLHIATSLLDLDDIIVDPQTFVAKKINSEAWKTELWEWKETNQHWNYSADDWVLIEVYTNLESVEFALGDEKIGSQQLKEQDDRIIRWAIPYQELPLTFIGIKHEKEKVRKILDSAKNASNVEVKIYRDKEKNLIDLIQLEVQLIDECGIPVSHQERELELELEPTSRLTIIGMDNGSITDTHGYNANTVKTQQGRALIVLKGFYTGIEKVILHGVVSDGIEIAI